MKRVCVIGSGAAGLLLLSNLEKGGIHPDQVIVIDPHLCGGDLNQKWSSVRSNTVWRRLLDSVPYPGPLPEQWSSIDPEKPCILQNYIEYLKEIVRPFLNKCELHCTYATKVWNEGDSWKIQLKTSTTPLSVNVLLLATGSEPKHLDLPYPSIPLSVALNKEQLSTYVKRGQHILLFGTAHSATLIVQNLVDIGAMVTNLYASPKPFYFDRDGEYDGLKQDAAEIADRILANQLPVKLVAIQDTASVIRQTKSVDGVIYAIGFESRNPFELKEYDGLTGQIKGFSTAWGFGIAYPNKAADGIHWDVSIPAFQAHIQKQMPDILASLQ
jgi:cation diffusion facilitator CzcD-associated flavoprotein CzcO